jgi:hypothetical protein
MIKMEKEKMEKLFGNQDRALPPGGKCFTFIAYLKGNLPWVE